MKPTNICHASDNLEVVAPGVSRQIMSYNEQLMMVRVRFEKGAIGALHAHPHTQGSYVASGSFDVQIDDQHYLLNAGDTFLASSDAPHGVVCLEAGELIDVFTPMRADFLK